MTACQRQRTFNLGFEKWNATIRTQKPALFLDMLYKNILTAMTDFIKLVSLKGTFILPLLFLFVLSARAQNGSGGKNKWHFLVEPYLVFPNLNGTTGIGTLRDAELEADPSDTFNNFKIGTILYSEMAKGKWAFSSDLVYMNIYQDAPSVPVINSGNVNLKQLSWELAGLRNLLPEAGVGGRFNSIKTNVDLQTKTLNGRINAQSNSMEQIWIRTLCDNS